MQIDAVEETRLAFRRAHARRDTRVVEERRTADAIHAPAVLRALERKTRPREVRVGVAEPRAVDVRVDLDGPVLGFANAADVQLQRLPWAQTVAELLGEHVRIAGDLVRLLRDQS